MLLFQPVTLERLVSQECAELQEEEMIALMAIYGDDITIENESSKYFKIILKMSDDEDEVVDLWFRYEDISFCC